MPRSHSREGLIGAEGVPGKNYENGEDGGVPEDRPPYPELHQQQQLSRDLTMRGLRGNNPFDPRVVPNGQLQQFQGRRTLPRRPSSVASAPPSGGGHFTNHNGKNQHGMLTFRNDPVPTARHHHHHPTSHHLQQPHALGDRPASGRRRRGPNYFSDGGDLLTDTDTDDSYWHGPPRTASGVPATQQPLLLSTFQPLASGSSAARSPVPVMMAGSEQPPGQLPQQQFLVQPQVHVQPPNHVHFQTSQQNPLSRDEKVSALDSAISPYVIPPPFDSAVFDLQLGSGPGQQDLLEFRHPTPEEIQRDVDAVLQSMGLSAEEVPDRQADGDPDADLAGSAPGPLDDDENHHHHPAGQSFPMPKADQIDHHGAT